MIWRYGVMGLGLLAVLASCQGTRTTGEQRAATAATATNADDEPTAEEPTGEVVGGGTVDARGPLPDVGEFRNPRFGRSRAFR